MDSDRNIYKSAGIVIKRRRKAVGPPAMKQEKLARAAGLTRTSISNIELGRQKVLLDTFCLIARALDVPPTELLEDILNENALTTTTTTRDVPLSSSTDDPVVEYLIKEIIKQRGGNGK